MKNKKWLSYTLGILLSLIALTAVGVAGFRAGMMQTAPFGRMAGDRHNFANNSQSQMPQGNVPNNNNNGQNNSGGNPQAMQGNFHGNEFGNRQQNDRRGGSPISGGFFGLIHLAIAGILLWFGYKLVKNSGWKLVRVESNTPATPTTASEPVSTKNEEKKESE
ncbi:MAG: hypothetical protein U0Z26_16030 [Anaerolineales bacterium]